MRFYTLSRSRTGIDRNLGYLLVLGEGELPHRAERTGDLFGIKGHIHRVGQGEYRCSS